MKSEIVIIFLTLSLFVSVTPVSADATIVDSYQPSINFLFGNGNGTSFAIFAGETFNVPTFSWTISSVQFFMNKTNTWTGAIVAQLWNIQGIPGTNGLPLGTSSTGAFPQGSLADSTPITNSALMPTNATSIPVTFSFPSKPTLQPGNYVVTLTENSTQAVSASPLIGHGLTAIPHVIVQIGMATGGLANHNSFRDTGIILNNGRNFWFVITGIELTPSTRASSILSIFLVLIIVATVVASAKSPENAFTIIEVGISAVIVVGTIFIIFLAVGL
jgi:hypothetical protein